MEFEITDKDDINFIEIVKTVINCYIINHKFELSCVIKIDNWFDHKWLNFSGKVLGALGVWKNQITIPPFNPNRVVEQRVYRVKEDKKLELIDAPLLHVRQSSGENLNKKMKYVVDTGLFVWWSGNTNVNRKGSFMLYLQTSQAQDTWYASFDLNKYWKLYKTKGIPKDIVEGMIEIIEPTDALNQSTAEADSDK